MDHLWEVSQPLRPYQRAQIHDRDKNGGMTSLEWARSVHDLTAAAPEACTTAHFVYMPHGVSRVLHFHHTSTLTSCSDTMSCLSSFAARDRTSTPTFRVGRLVTRTGTMKHRTIMAIHYSPCCTWAVWTVLPYRDLLRSMHGTCVHGKTRKMIGCIPCDCLGILIATRTPMKARTCVQCSRHHPENGAICRYHL